MHTFNHTIGTRLREIYTGTFIYTAAYESSTLEHDPVNRDEQVE